MERQREIEIPVAGETLYGNLDIPSACDGIVIFAHGSGSSRLSPRNQMVARYLSEAGHGTLLFDLLTRAEERVDSETAVYRFDIELLARRLVAATDWLVATRAEDLPIGYFGSSTGAAAALIAATETRHAIAAIVSRGGRPDLAGRALPDVTSPTLLLVGGNDAQVLELNRRALAAMRCDKQLIVIAGATHLFPEPGALAQVCARASTWFDTHFNLA